VNVVHRQGAHDAHVDLVILGPAVEPLVQLRHLNRCEPGLDGRRDYPTSIPQEPLACVAEEAEHSLAESEVPQRLGDEHVHGLLDSSPIGELVDEDDAVFDIVLPDHLARYLDGMTCLDGVHPPGACLAGKQGQHSRSSADVEDDVPWPDDLVNRPAEGAHTLAVLDHRLVVGDGLVAARKLVSTAARMLAMAISAGSSSLR
jgi:hypothetical protein